MLASAGRSRVLKRARRAVVGEIEVEEVDVD